jgi:hypothetical protein
MGLARIMQKSSERNISDDSRCKTNLVGEAPCTRRHALAMRLEQYWLCRA